jgi:hypothetical protein
MRSVEDPPGSLKALVKAPASTFVLFRQFLALDKVIDTEFFSQLWG